MVSIFHHKSSIYNDSYIFTDVSDISAWALSLGCYSKAPGVETGRERADAATLAFIVEQVVEDLATNRTLIDMVTEGNVPLINTLKRAQIWIEEHQGPMWEGFVIEDLEGYFGPKYAIQLGSRL